MSPCAPRRCLPLLDRETDSRGCCPFPHDPSRPVSRIGDPRDLPVPLHRAGTEQMGDSAPPQETLEIAGIWGRPRLPRRRTLRAAEQFLAFRQAGVEVVLHALGFEIRVRDPFPW